MSQRRSEFEWSYRKAELNIKKHGVTFEEAETAFDDPNALVQEDELHSDHEPREALMGYSYRNQLLVVSFIQRSLELIRLRNLEKIKRPKLARAG